MNVPDHALVVSHEHHDKAEPESMHVAVKDAFNRAERQLRAFTERRKRRTKIHVAPAVGIVVEASENGQRGVIEAPDGSRFSFDERSALDGAAHELSVGQPVSFSEPSDDRPNIARSVVRIPMEG